MSAGFGRRRRLAKKAMKQNLALFWTRRLFEMGLIDAFEAADRINHIIRQGGVK